jgi:hypothetical protein
MALNVEMVTFDCSDPRALATWWAEQFDGTTQELIEGEFVVVIRPEGPRLGFQKVPDPTPGKNRVHVDFSAADVDAEVSRLVAAGRARPASTRSATTSAGSCWPIPPATRSASRAVSARRVRRR